MKAKLLSRKLQHTTLALTASAAVFAVLLLAGTPALPPAAEASSSLLLPANEIAMVDTVAAAAGSALEDADQAPAADRAADTPSATRRHRSPNRTRALLALPYFSFAQGLRHTRS